MCACGVREATSQVIDEIPSPAAFCPGFYPHLSWPLPLSLSLSLSLSMCVCVPVCVCVRTCACVRTCTRVCARICRQLNVSLALHDHPLCVSLAPKPGICSSALKPFSPESSRVPLKSHCLTVALTAPSPPPPPPPHELRLVSTKTGCKSGRQIQE